MSNLNSNLTDSSTSTASFSRSNKILPKPILPKTLQKLDLSDLRDFVKRYKAYEDQVGEGRIKVENYIATELWRKLKRRHDCFKSGNSKEVLKYLEKLLAEEEKDKLDSIPRKMRNICFKNSKSSFYKSLLDYIERSEELISDAKQVARNNLGGSENINEEGIKENAQDQADRIVKKTLENLPPQLGISKENFYNKSLNTMKKLRKEIESMKKFLKNQVYIEGYVRPQSSETESELEDEGYESYDSNNSESIRRFARKQRALKKKKAVKAKKKLSTKKNTNKAEIEDVSETIHFMTVFLAEEKECQDIFMLCYGCKRPGHIRRDGPEGRNKFGYPRRLVGSCWNCDGNHRWQDCTVELKQSLKLKKASDEARAKEDKEKLLKQQGQSGNGGNNYQSNNNGNYYNNGRNGNYRGGYRNNNYNRGNFGNRNWQQRPANEVFMEDLMSVLDERYGPECRTEINSAVPEEVYQLNIPKRVKKEISEVKQQIYEVNGIDSNFNLIRSKVEQKEQIYCRKDGKWIEVDGKADTGASTTVCSLHNHKHVMLHCWDICGQNIVLRVADGTMHKVMKKCLLEVKIDDTEVGHVEALAVDLKGWTSVLIGLDVLTLRGLVVKTKK